MVKNANTNESTVDAATLSFDTVDGANWLFEKTVDWNGTTYSIGSLPVQAIAYLIDYGAGKSEQDCIAGLKGAIDGTGKGALSNEERAKLAAEHGFDADCSNADLFEAESHKRKAERWERIIAGTIGTRSGGPRKVGIDKVMADIAHERLVAIAAERKMTLPKKAAELRPMIDALLKRDEADIRSEAERRISAAPTVDDDFFAELFAAKS